MSDQYLGEIRLFPFNFAPWGWALCNGQLLPIQQNEALFSLLGTTYGGDGITSFALPDLQSRVPIHAGTSAVGTVFAIGQTGGSETAGLTTQQLPSHSHGWPVTSGAADVEKGGVPDEPIATGYLAFNSATPDATLAAGSTTLTGSGTPHQNMAPYLAVNYCIAIFAANFPNLP
jgi:microcystin-dependent protein